MDESCLGALFWGPTITPEAVDVGRIWTLLFPTAWLGNATVSTSSEAPKTTPSKSHPQQLTIRMKTVCKTYY